ncbi:MAG TPA: hypothetical protein PLS26_00595 [Bacteroidales bacterium]|nr:hypothetical protein [Bacteroidales bacterium]
MKKLFFFFFAIFFIVSGSRAQGHISASNILNLRFLDVSTGYFVIPDEVIITQRENKDFAMTITSEKIAENGTISISFMNGTYDINVNAPNYFSMSTFFQLTNDTLNVNFNLEPIAPLNELTDTYIQSLQAQDAVVITGVIVDEISGKPLNHVKVYLKDNTASAFSKENGYFVLSAPLPEKEAEIADRNILIFEKDDYITEIRKNFDMWPYGDAIIQIRMNKGTGTHEADIILSRQSVVTLKTPS